VAGFFFFGTSFLSGSGSWQTLWALIDFEYLQWQWQLIIELPLTAEGTLTLLGLIAGILLWRPLIDRLGSEKAIHCSDRIPCIVSAN
jgi:hypothetical protein